MYNVIFSCFGPEPQNLFCGKPAGSQDKKRKREG